MERAHLGMVFPALIEMRPDCLENLLAQGKEFALSRG